MRMKLISGLAMAVAFGAAAHATEFVQNGGFETVTTTSASGSFELNDGAGSVSNWSGNGGYNILFNTSTWTSTSMNANFQPVTEFGSQNQNLWQAPGNQPNIGTHVMALDGASGSQGALQQTINGLVAGQTYTLTFDWAAGQLQSRNAGSLTEQLDVTLGSQSIVNTSVDNYANHGSSPWQEVSMTFTAANSGSQVLSFLSIGTPGEDPPMALLDNVSLTGGVPEPATWGLMLVGVGAIGATLRRRRALALA
jgi:hypothetical protein